MAHAFSHSYLAGEPAARALFPSDFRDGEERIRRVRLAAEHKVVPALLAMLRAQQAAWPASPARQANLDVLAAGGAAVVATGQQIGLFLGPLYGFYKAASAVALARALSAESGVPCVPLFWLQTEDHDFDEIRSCRVARDDGELVSLTLPDEHEGGGRTSVAYRVLPAAVTDLLDELAQALGATPAASEVLASLREHYRPGRTLAGAFAATLASLFAEEGLLVLDPRDPVVAELAASRYRACLDDAGAIEAGLRQRQAELGAAGFAVQVPIREHGALVFFHRDGLTGPRFRVARPSGADEWQLAGGGTRLRHADLLDVLAREPLRFSTSALLRPIVQDTLLPTAAYVAGPGELNYFAELPPLYERFAMTPPLLVPRGRFLCVDARARRRLAALGLSAGDLALPAAELRARVHVGGPDTVAAPALRALAQSRITPALDEIVAVTTAASPGLRRPAERARASVAHALERLIDRYARVLVEQDAVAARRLRALALSLHPQQVPQERYYGWPHLAGRHGPRELKRLVLDHLHREGPYLTTVRELLP